MRVKKMRKARINPRILPKKPGEMELSFLRWGSLEEKQVSRGVILNMLRLDAYEASNWRRPVGHWVYKPGSQESDPG